MASNGKDGAPALAPPPPPAPPPATPLATPKSRALGRLWVQVKKAAIPAIVTGVLGYAGDFVIPPTAVFDYLFRQNPSDLGGTWIGSATGTIASLRSRSSAVAN